MRRYLGLFVALVSPALGALLASVLSMLMGANALVGVEREPPALRAQADGVTIRNGTGQIVMQRIEPRARWSDLQVAETTRALLQKLAAEPRANGGAVSLFSGADKAPKSRAVEVLAAELHLALYRVDLSVVVSKYIGETEKNLDQVFAAVKPSDAVLFFDDADALFGTRTEVKDSHDRYANQEISYLLQRLEQFEGLAILATNQPQQIDPAVLRRFRHVVEFASDDASKSR